MKALPSPQNVSLGLPDALRTWLYQLFARVTQQPRLLVSTQANLAGLNLAAEDQGALVWVMDYNHVLFWDGAEFTWGPGDSGSGMQVTFGAGVVPATGWVACKGQAVKPLLSNGQLGNAVALPNTANVYFRI